jgi:hypothetical protein
MSEDKSKPDEQVEEQPQADETPDVEAHTMRARSLEDGEEGGDEAGKRSRRIGGR